MKQTFENLESPKKKSTAVEIMLRRSMQHGVEVERETEFTGPDVQDAHESKKKVTLVQESATANGRPRSSRNIRVMREEEKKKQKVNFGGTLSTGEARAGPLPLPAGITSRYLRIVPSKIDFKDVKPGARMIASLSVYFMCDSYYFMCHL